MIGAHETVRVRYDRNEPVVESERTTRGRGGSSRSKKPAVDDSSRVEPAARAKGGSRRPTTGHARPPRSSQGKRLAHTKRDERERRQRAIRLRRTLVAAISIVAIIVCMWGLVAFAGSAAFAVTEVTVEGTRHLSDDQARELAAVPEDATMFTVSPGEIERRIAASPWVAEVQVTRDFAHTLVIAVIERVPAAVIDAGGKELWVVSADGWWLGERSAEESGVPVIRDIEEVKPRPGRRVSTKEIANAAKLAAGLSPEMLGKVAHISAPSVEKTAVITTDDVVVFFGEASDLATKERIALEILEREAGKVVYVNVRVVESPTWRGLDQ